METKEIRLRAITADTRLRVRSTDDGSQSRTIEGYAIVFGSESVPLWQESDGSTACEVIDAKAIDRSLLDASDIKMTLYHDMSRMLARSKNGKGTLRYDIDERGVRFEFDAPRTQWGDEALELVSRGEIDGCSFMFATKYGDKDYVSRATKNGRTVYTVRKVTGIYDFTLTPDPAYPQTECQARAAAVTDEPEEAPDNSWADEIAELEKRINH